MRAGAAALLFAPLALSACATDRYVGSIGRDGTYSNRGYGLAVSVKGDGLEDRWTVIDPANLEAAPEGVRPTVHDEPIDLDGDGMLDMKETTRFQRPTLRLLSKTSTGAVLSLDVALYGKNNKSVGLESLLLLELQRLQEAAPGLDGTLASTSSVSLPAGNDVRIAELVPPPGSALRAYRVALVDQPDFVAEQGFVRRQVVRVVLAAKALTTALRRDQDLFLRHLFLGRKGGAETNQEKW